jgi:capsular exopolysaccharide synthesis family protein
MSYVLNLFQQSAGHRYDFPSAPVGTTPEIVARVAELQGVPIVQADIQPSCRAVFHTDPHTLGSDRFRLLRIHLRAHWNAGKLKTLLITSPLPHDGKTTIAINLATALSEQGMLRVLLVEADLHRPSLTVQLGLNAWNGLTDCLDGGLNAMSGIRRLEPLGWYLLPAGEPRQNPTELLQSAAFQDLLEKMLPHFDWILIDSPPVIPLTDAITLRQHTDATLLVVRAGKTPQDNIEEAIRLVGKPNILGIVLNCVGGLDHIYSRYGYYRSRSQ